MKPAELELLKGQTKELVYMSENLYRLLTAAGVKIDLAEVLSSVYIEGVSEANSWQEAYDWLALAFPEDWSDETTKQALVQGLMMLYQEFGLSTEDQIKLAMIKKDWVIAAAEFSKLLTEKLQDPNRTVH